MAQFGGLFGEINLEAIPNSRTRILHSVLDGTRAKYSSLLLLLLPRYYHATAPPSATMPSPSILLFVSETGEQAHDLIKHLCELKFVHIFLGWARSVHPSRRSVVVVGVSLHVMKSEASAFVAPGAFTRNGRQFEYSCYSPFGFSKTQNHPHFFLIRQSHLIGLMFVWLIYLYLCALQ